MRLYLIKTFCFNWLSPIQHWQGEVRGTASLLPGDRSVGLTLGIIDLRGRRLTVTCRWGGNSGSPCGLHSTTLCGWSVILGGDESCGWVLGFLWHYPSRGGRGASLRLMEWKSGFTDTMCGWGEWAILEAHYFPVGSSQSLLSLFWHCLGGDIGVPHYSLVSIEIQASHSAFAGTNEVKPVFHVSLMCLPWVPRFTAGLLSLLHFCDRNNKDLVP